MDYKKIISYIGFAVKSGNCQKGTSNVLNSIKNNEADIVFINSIASDNTKKKFENSAKYYNICYKILNFEVFDSLFDSNTMVISLKKSGLSSIIKTIVEKEDIDG